jgi:hypothetical protein
MKKIGIIVFTLVAALTTSSAFAGSCPMQMKAIDAALSSNTSMSEADREYVKELRAMGEEMHKSGDHSESVELLNEAKELLGI